MVQQNLQAQTSEAELHTLQNQWQQVTGQKKTTVNALRFRINQEIKFLYCKKERNFRMF